MVPILKTTSCLLLAITILQTSISQPSKPCTSLSDVWSRVSGLRCTENSINEDTLLVGDKDPKKITSITFVPGNVSSIPENLFLYFSNIKSLELRDCQVREFHPKSFNRLVKLTYLNLENNELSTIPPLAFETLKQLDKLDLGHNNISQIFFDSFKGLTGLKVMYLRNNAIRILPTGCFRDLVLLEGFYIDYNELEELGPAFLEKSPKVHEIDLSHNKLMKIDANAFKGLNGLKHLYLNHNNLTMLPAKVFSDLSSLVRLRLWHNSFTNFETGTFDGLHNLETLELEHNKLKVIHENTFSGLVNLKVLELHDNEISSFDSPKVLKQLSALESITLSNNHWNCHTLKNLTEILEDIGIEFEGGGFYKGANVDGMRCTNDQAFHLTPEDIKAKLADLNLKEYINNDFKNSSLYNFFNGGYVKSNFTDYVESGFKNSNLYKFFNENFVNSSLYQYITSKNLELAKEPKSEALHSTSESFRHDPVYLTFISVGIIMFFVGVIFFVVAVRLIRKRRSEDKQILVEPNIDNHELSSVRVP